MQKHKDSWNIVSVGYSKNNENNTIFKHPKFGPRLVVRYPKGSINPGAAGRPVGGMGFYACPAPIFPALDVELSYEVAFDDSFKPQNGGKLPGLFLSQAGAADTSGGSGGQNDDLHGSLRIMWRGDFSAEAYVYSPVASAVPEYLQLPESTFNPEFGDSLWRGLFKLDPKEWNKVRMRVRVNTLGFADGSIHVTVNKTKHTFDKMAWRSRNQVVVSALFFSTFYGGSSERFACPNDTTARFRNFSLKKFG